MSKCPLCKDNDIDIGHDMVDGSYQVSDDSVNITYKDLESNDKEVYEEPQNKETYYNYEVALKICTLCKYVEEV